MAREYKVEIHQNHSCPVHLPSELGISDVKTMIDGRTSTVRESLFDNSLFNRMGLVQQRYMSSFTFAFRFYLPPYYEIPQLTGLNTPALHANRNSTTRFLLAFKPTTCNVNKDQFSDFTAKNINSVVVQIGLWKDVYVDWQMACLVAAQRWLRSSVQDTAALQCDGRIMYFTYAKRLILVPSKVVSAKISEEILRTIKSSPGHVRKANCCMVWCVGIY